MDKFLELLWDHIYVLLISAVPIIELRGAIPVGAAMGLAPIPTFLVAVLGNLLPVPVILFFVKPVLLWMKRFRIFRPIVEWLERKAMKQGEKLKNGAFIGLMLFVGIPLPGTGAWTGALVASLFDMKKRYSFPAIILGVIIAGVIMTLVSYGFLSALEFLLP